MFQEIKYLALPTAVVLVFLAGAAVEILAGRRWRSRSQRAASTLAYLLLPFGGVALTVHGTPPIISLLAIAATYQGLKWSWLTRERRRAEIVGCFGAMLLMKTDDGAQVSTSLLGLDRRPVPGETIWVTLTSSSLFGWRLKAEID
jgi:hypothetical protein